MRDLSGQTFGSYRLEGLLGRGGMGEVYRARHIRLAGRLAAVKLLPASFASEPDFIRRFEHEANAAASLDHPNILPVWDYGEQDGIPYLAMPLVTSGSLKDLLESRGSLSPTEAERYLTPIAEALDYAHSRGLLHRDVKPANILLRDDGRPLLADFGIAKAIEAGQTGGLTQAGGGIGTPEYMAPEQIEGRAERRSDLYSLAMTLYQMLSGRVPFDGATPYEIALKQLSNPLPPLRRFRPELSPAIEAVVQKALSKDPAGRYGSGREFAAAFRDALARPRGAAPTIVGMPIVGATTPLERPPAAPPARRASAPVAYAPPGGGAPAPASRGGRNTSWPLIAAALLVAGLILVIGGFGAYTAFFRPTPTPPRPTNTIAPTPNAGATQTAAALATIGAITPTAPPTATATPDLAATGTTVAGATATANALAEATATASAARASASAAASAAAEATAQANAAATASANAAASATARASRSATSAALTATAAAPPTVTPTPAPTNTLIPPTTTPPPPTAPPTGNTWGPALAALTGGKRYNDPAGRFALSVPTNWVQGTGGDSAVAFAPPDNSANVTVTLDRVPTNTTIDAYNTAAEQQLRSQFSNYTPVSVEKVTVNGRQAYKRVSRVAVQGRTIQLVQVYFIEGNVAHVLTFTCLPADYDRLARIFDGIAGSYAVGN